MTRRERLEVTRTHCHRLNAPETAIGFACALLKDMEPQRKSQFQSTAIGELRAVKLGSRTLILRDELQRFLATLPIATTATMKTTSSAVHAKHGDAA
jgi:hypothetical protein